MNNQLSNIKECESKSDEPIIWTLVTSAMLLLLIEIAEMAGFSLYDRILPVNTQKRHKKHQWRDDCLSITVGKQCSLRFASNVAEILC